MSGDTGPAHSSAREPIFILSPARGFSTISIALLAGHPAIYGLPELLTFSAPTIGAMLSGVGCGCYAPGAGHPPECRVLRVSLSGPSRAVAQLHEDRQDPEAIMRAETWLRDHADWTTERLLDHLLACAEPRRGVEKSPNTVRSADNLGRCLNAYPRARYIHLTRHPVTAQRSIQAHAALLRPETSRKSNVVHAATTWYQSHATILRALTALPRHQWLRVRGEDLVNDPCTWLPQILQWLGLAYDGPTVAGMLATERWVFAGTGPSGRLFGGDHKFMQRPELRPQADPAPIAFDAAWGLPAEMRERISALGRYLGYDVSADEAECG